MSILGCCSSGDHKRESPYPSDKVPKHLFLENPDKPDGKKYKTCFDCRKYRKNIRIKNKEKKLIEKTKEETENKEEKIRENLIQEKIKIENQLKNCGTECCPNYRHNKSGSGYPKENVPTAFFHKDFLDLESHKFKSCCYCRKTEREEENRRKEINNEKAKKEGKKVCTGCHAFKTQDEMGKNKDGTESMMCKNCKHKEKERAKNLRKEYYLIKFELMQEEECSCQRCKKIYLKPEENKEYCREIETYERDGQRYTLYEGNEILVKEFFEKYKSILEFRVIELDHLTEEEQRERGILEEEETYKSKKDNVSRLSSKKSMRNESKKCQILCVKCHLILTLLRKKVTTKFTSAELEKRNYVKNEKIKRGGCSICGFFDINLLEFLEFDHLDREEKNEDVAFISSNRYATLQELIEEIAQCRLLCKNCHIIWTHKQMGFSECII